MNFPHQPEQLTAVWLTDTLRQAGVLHEAQVVSFEVKPLPETAGIAGKNTFIRLTYNTSEDAAPQSIFAKFAFSDAEQRARWQNNYEQEVRFYKQFAPRVDLLTPRAFFSEFDEATGYFLLLLEDCSYGEVGDQAIGCSIEMARVVISEIAKFHASWWEHPEVSQHSWKWSQDSLLNRIQENYIRYANTLNDIPEIPEEPELVQTIQEHSLQFARVMKHLQKKPYTLIHHDFHLSNLVFITTSEATKVMVLDWQDMSIGRGPMDVAYFLGTSMSIEDRRASEKELLKLYHDALCANEVTNYTFDECWDDYRMSMFDLLWRAVLILGNRRLQGAAYTNFRDILGPRFFAAVVDLNSREMLTHLVS